MIPNSLGQKRLLRTARPIIPWLTVLAIFALSVAFLRWRADQAPDIFADEIIYTRIGVRLLGEKALVWDSGEPFLVHPPLYFLAEGVYQAFSRGQEIPLYGAGDIFSAVYSTRGLNAIFAGLTAGILFFFGRRFKGFWFGIFLVTLFILDPFGLRINRRAMLETLTALLILWAVYLLVSEREITSGYEVQRGIQAGLLLGLATLAKELAFITVAAVFLFGVWEIARSILAGRRFSISQATPFLTTLVAGATYAIYPLWIWSTGQLGPFMREKILGLQRLLGLVQITGWNRPGQSLVDLLLARFLDYGSSYFILGLGGMATLYILTTARDRRDGRFLGLWGLVLYVFFAFTALFGSGNDQFFYLLLGPAIVILGYAISAPFKIDLKKWPAVRQKMPPNPVSASGGWLAAGNKGISSALPEVNLLVIKVLLILILPYNAAHWILTYGIGQDNGYYQLARFGQERLPPGEPLNASGDPVKFRYFFPDRPVTAAATPEEAQARSVHYFALAPKDVRSRYGRIQPELEAWILQTGERIFAVEGSSYGEIYLYRVDYPDSARPASLNMPTNEARWRSFKPAAGGYLGLFLATLILWITICLVTAAGMRALKRNPVGSTVTGRTQPTRVFQAGEVAVQPDLGVRRGNQDAHRL